MTGTYQHRSIMVEEVLEALRIRPDGVYADGTAGGGGHSLAIGQRLSANGVLICNDRDEDAQKACRERLCGLSCKVRMIRGNFSDLPEHAGVTFDGVRLCGTGVFLYEGCSA